MFVSIGRFIGMIMGLTASADCIGLHFKAGFSNVYTLNLLNSSKHLNTRKNI